MSTWSNTDSTDSEVNVTIHAAPEGRSVISCDSNNGTKFRTIGTDGEAQKREKTVYNTYDEDEGERGNAGCLTPLLLKSQQPHPSYKKLAIKLDSNKKIRGKKFPPCNPSLHFNFGYSWFCL